MKKLTRMTTAVLILMFFVVGNITAQKHSKADMSRDKMLQNMPMNCDSTMMKKHMKDCKMDCDEKMENHKVLKKDCKMDCDEKMENHKGMMKDCKMNCDEKMENHKEMKKDCKMDCDEKMENHKGMMKDCDEKMENHKGMMKDCDEKMENHKGMMMKHHKEMMKDGKMMKNKSKMMGNSMIHKGIIDVNSIDANKDGKVYQDMMDWNVISDKPGKCPNCGMKLKEVSIDKAKKNLRENGFKVK